MNSNKTLKINNSNSFSVFEKIKGTDVYWKDARNEMIACIEQLGPFHIFFTLSCADKRWSENYSTIFHLAGHNVTYKSTEHCVNSPEYEFYQENVLIDGKPIAEFFQDGNVHELVKKNVLVITRNFDHRVQMFRNHILMGKNSPMCVKFYRWRIEFQLRGAAHIHGVLWLDLEKLSHASTIDGTYKYAQIQTAINNLQSATEMSDSEETDIVNMINEFVTCSRNDKSTSGIIESVNWHCHTKTCKKRVLKNVSCRFSFPKFPSYKTTIARPCSKNVRPEERTRIGSEAAKCLRSIKATLSSFPNKQLELDKYLSDNDLTLKSIVEGAGYTLAEYHEALSLSSTGIVIVLKRELNEIFVNNYNKEWILAWNGNLDLQICLDYFAVITYITDYYSKSETKLTQTLIDVSKQSIGENLQSRMRLMAQAFLTHRQCSFLRLF